ncbi:MAG: hypothetical protein MJY99_04630 [Fibrobacter sp.]|uniref:hypothetical protein n=1 Tax=Fibrobacter sp. TaxID=35828 RepID=UPI00388D783E|nr:hypothetical protein [Fibrobacter sp.]
MPFTSKRPDGKFTNADKVKMFQQMGSVAAVIALALIILIESGYAGAQMELANMGLTAMIVVLAVSLIGSMYFKNKK